MTWPKSEVELGAVAVAWLRAHGWEVYQEVSIFSSSADIVACYGRLRWIIELKTRLSFEVIEQAYDWKRARVAHLVSVAVPVSPKVHGAYHIRSIICEQMGIGLLAFDEESADRVNLTKAPRWHYGRSPELVHPPFLRRALTDKITLCEQQKEYLAAGSPCGAGWTPYKQTSANIVEYVTRNPGTTIKDVVERIETHYHSKSTARACISQGIQNGWIPGITAEKQGNSYRLFKAESE